MSMYRILEIKYKLDTFFPKCYKKIPYTRIKMATDTVYPKPLAGPAI